MSQTVTITMSGTSWDDAFHPYGTEFYKDNPAMPQARFIRRGRGSTAVFEGVPIAAAHAAAEHLSYYAYSYSQDVCQEDDPALIRSNYRHRQALLKDLNRLLLQLKGLP